MRSLQTRSFGILDVSPKRKEARHASRLELHVGARTAGTGIRPWSCGYVVASTARRASGSPGGRTVGRISQEVVGSLLGFEGGGGNARTRESVRLRNQSPERVR